MKPSERAKGARTNEPIWKPLIDAVIRDHLTLAKVENRPVLHGDETAFEADRISNSKKGGSTVSKKTPVMETGSAEISRGNGKREVVVITRHHGKRESVTYHERFIGGEWRRKKVPSHS